MSDNKKILMVVTNACKLKDGKGETGVYFEEFAVPYNAFKKQGYDVTVATLTGEIAPIDPLSENLAKDLMWDEAKKQLNDTKKLDTIDHNEYDAIVFPGGHGPMFDIAESEYVGKVVSDFAKQGKLIAAICHGPAGLLKAKNSDGTPLVDGQRITCFSNEEEEEVGRAALIPFFLEDALKELNGFYVQEDPGEINVMVDKNIITGQNYQSSHEFADAIIKYLTPDEE